MNNDVGENLRRTDLNQLQGPEANHPSRMRRNFPPTKVQSVEVIFQNLEDRLVEEIERWDAVVGCTAWLTSPRILQALASRSFAQILVQKEDFLRPEPEGPNRNFLAELYKGIRGGLRCECPGKAAYWIGMLDPPEVEGVRCVGVRPSDSKETTFPRMHHKFLVFCEDWGPDGIPCHLANWGDDVCDSYRAFRPKMVWTGSFNPTGNGSRSLENAVLIQDHAIAQAFADEHSVLLSISEALDWKQRYVAPDHDFAVS